MYIRTAAILVLLIGIARGEYYCTPLGNTCQECIDGCPSQGTYANETACQSDAANACFNPSIIVDAAAIAEDQGEEQTLVVMDTSPVRWQCAEGACRKCWSQATCISDLAAFRSLGECLQEENTCSSNGPESGFQCIIPNEGCKECGGIDGPPCVPDLAKFESMDKCELGDNQCFPQETPSDTKTKFICDGLYRSCQECESPYGCNRPGAYNSYLECQNDNDSMCYRDPKDQVEVPKWQCVDPVEGCKECFGADDCVLDVTIFAYKEACQNSNDNECIAAPAGRWQCADPTEGCVECLDDCIPDLGAFDSKEVCELNEDNQCKYVSTPLYQCVENVCTKCSSAEGNCIADMGAVDSMEKCEALCTG